MTQNTAASNRFGEQFRKARLAKGLTIRQVGRALDVNDRTVARWQSGGSLPRYERLHDLAELLQVPQSYLLGEEQAA
jgi:transcriptional regulator with XRE-family HTH domain